MEEENNVINWNFPSNNHAEKVGFNEAGIETFKGSQFDSLAREICQNSLDARADKGKLVKVEFILDEIERDEIYGIDELKRVMELCKEECKNDVKANTFFNNAEEICSSETIRVLRVSDFNTTGLIGSKEEYSSPWSDLVKSSGISNKANGAGGSFGIGKAAPFACSDLRTIFYSTLDKDENKAYQGVARLISFRENGSDDFTQGKGYYGYTDRNRAVLGVQANFNFKRTEVGSDIYILGFMKNDEWKELIVKAVIKGYLLGVYNETLEVVVGDITINKGTLEGLIETYKNDLSAEYNYYKVLVGGENVTSITKDFEGMGDIELKISVNKNFINRSVLMARNNGMKIFDKKNISSAINFAGICMLQGEDVNEYFRKMENPQHAKWECNRFSDEEKLQKEAKAKTDALFKFIKDTVLEIGKNTISAEVDAFGAGDLLPDIDDKKGENENNIEDVTDKTVVQNELKKAKIKDNSDTNSTNGEVDENGDCKAGKINHNDGSNEPNDGSNEPNDGSNEPNGTVGNGKSMVQVKPFKMRLFRTKNGSYKLIFTAAITSENVCIKIFLSGEQSNIKVEIIEAIMSDSKLETNKNIINLGDIIEGESYSLEYKINHKETYSMGVNLYGN